MILRRCQGCKLLFKAKRWRSHCFFCGGDDEADWWGMIAVAAAFDIVMLLLWKLMVWRFGV